jgi:hypothetical protein
VNVEKMVERLTGLVDRVGELSDDETLWLLAYLMGELSDDETLWLLAYLIGAVPDAVTADYVEMKR